MAKNPSLQLGIDATDPGNQTLGNRRADAVRDALVQAGVPSYKIQTGAFGDPQLRTNGRVEVLLSTHLSSSN
jgi:outer membrane protein OmpA-like peptidoglycan-associated protein